MPEPRLRVAMFSDSALPILNGVSVSIESLVGELRNLGHAVDLYTASHPGHLDSNPNTFRFPSFETPWTRGYPFATAPFYPMLRHFRRHQYNIVHTHTPFTVGFVGMRWAESHGLPLVSTYHTLYDRYAHYVPFFPRRYIRFKIAKHTNFYYNRVGHVIVPSDAALKWLRRHSVDTPATIVPTGAPRPKLLDRSEVRQSLGIQPEQRVLLYVGRLAKEKNLELLFESAARVFAQVPMARLWLVGDGPHRTACAEHVRALGIGDRVRFVGVVPRSEVDPYYAAADAFVFGSITETQGLVVQEAMAYGVPAVAVLGGGASEGIEEGLNGFVVRNDPEAFAERVLQILGDDALHARLSEGAFRSVRAHGATEMASLVLDVYRNAIAGCSEAKTRVDAQLR